MIIDNKGRLFGKVSIVDLFAVLMVGAVIFVVVFTFGRREGLALEEARYVQLTFFSPSVDDFTAYAIASGSRVTDDDEGVFMGHVIDIAMGDSIYFQPDRQGRETAAHREGFYSIAVTTRVLAPMTAGAVVLGGLVYAVGDEAHIWAGNARLVVQISAIREE